MMKNRKSKIYEILFIILSLIAIFIIIFLFIRKLKKHK